LLKQNMSALPWRKNKVRIPKFWMQWMDGTQRKKQMLQPAVDQKEEMDQPLLNQNERKNINILKSIFD